MAARSIRRTSSEVKKPSESKGPWDYYKVRATIPADQAFRPSEGRRVPLVK
jgi:branched-chain amino acid transport system substrate-binding protein